MSDIDQLKTQFQTRFDALLSTVVDTVKEVFQQEEATLESSISDDQNLSGQFSGEDFPKVVVTFSAKSDSNIQHVLTMATGHASQLYAWMLGAEPEETVGNEQLEGLKEASNQVFGKITASLEGEDTAFTVDNIAVELAENAEGVSSSLPEDDGMVVSYSLKIGETDLPISHYFWEGEAPEKSDAESDIGDGLMGADAILDDEPDVDVAPAEFDDFGSEGLTNGKPRNLDMLLDVDLDVFVELGKKPMKIQEILKLGKGSIIELDKNAGEPLDIYVNNRKLAEGEVVIVDEYFGIRITQLASTSERIKSLG